MSKRWSHLNDLTEKIKRFGIASLTKEELFDYGKLYRRAASDLSRARSYGLDEPTIDYLNRLVGRAYGNVYRSESQGLPSLPGFFLREFPQAFRRNFRFIVAAFIVFIAGGLFAYSVSITSPDDVASFIDPNMLDDLAQRHTNQRGRPLDFIPSSLRPMVSSGIMSNNIMVSFIAFSGGVTAGIGTILVLFYNGVMLGMIATAIHQHSRDVSMNFWSFVAPHGVIELPAIFIAAGAGLVLGYALVNPGEYTRKDALKLAAREAVKLIFGVIAMLIVAGVIEAFFSPAPEIPHNVKFLFAACLFTGLCAYLGLCGRTVSG